MRKAPEQRLPITIVLWGFPVALVLKNLPTNARDTLYARQQKKHRCVEQSFGLCGRGQGWDGLGEWH